MRMALVPAGLFLLLPLSLVAQTTPKAELFGGYSFVRIEERSLHGWDVSLAGNFNKNLGFVAEASGHYGSETFSDILGTTDSKLSFHSFLFGPRVSERSLKWFTPFAHALLGFSRVHKEIDRTGNPATAISLSADTSSFAMALGVGLDVAGDSPVSFRIVQVDYFLLRPEGVKREGVRISSGLVFRFGRRQD